jgi:transposase-like protein
MRTTKFVSQEDRRSAALLRERINQGIKNVDLAREFGVTERTIYRWKSKYEEDLKELNREAA